MARRRARSDVDEDRQVEIVSANNQDLWMGVLKWQSGKLGPVWMSASPVPGPAGDWYRAQDLFIAASLDGGETEIAIANNVDKWTGVLKWQNNALSTVWMSPSPLVENDYAYIYNPLSDNNFDLVWRSGILGRGLQPSDSWSPIFSKNIFGESNYTFAYTSQRVFVMDPTNPQRLLVGADEVYETVNAASPAPTWSPIGPPPTAGVFVTAIAIAPSPLYDLRRDQRSARLAHHR